MDQINPFTNAPGNSTGPAPVQPVKPAAPKPKPEFSIKPLLKGAFLIIIGVVCAKLAFDSVFKQQPAPQPQAIKSSAKSPGKTTSAPAKPKSGKNKTENELS